MTSARPVKTSTLKVALAVSCGLRRCVCATWPVSVCVAAAALSAAHTHVPHTLEAVPALSAAGSPSLRADESVETAASERSHREALQPVSTTALQ